MSLGDRERELYLRLYRDKRKLVRELRSYALITLCVIVLLTSYIFIEIILKKVLALDKGYLGPNLEAYYSALGRSRRV